MNGGTPPKGSKYKYNARCTVCGCWISVSVLLDVYGRLVCPECRSSLRLRPRKNSSRRSYRNHRAYSLSEALKLYNDFISRGYSVDEAIEFVEALTGIALRFEKPLGVVR